MEGYIKLYRKLLDNPIVCKDGDHVAVWLYLLLNAEFAPKVDVFRGEKITLSPGQMIEKRKTISDKLSISESKVQRILKSFESEHQIEQQTANKNRLISIVNWSEYQAGEQRIEQQVNNKRTTTEQQGGVYNINKNIKNIKNNPLTPFESAVEDFKEFRKKIKKPMTDRAVELLLTKLTKLAGDDENLKIEIMNQSIMNGWQGVFALKDDGKPKPFVYDDSYKEGTSL